MGNILKAIKETFREQSSKSIQLFVVFVLLLPCSSVLYSQDSNDANNLLNLSDYLSYAAMNNAALKASFEQWKAAIEQVPQAKSLPDPKFTYGYYIREVETRVGPQRNKFDIMQTFPWFGTIEARTDEASAKAKAAQQKYEAKKLELFNDVKYIFYEYAYLAKAIEITEKNLELTKRFEQIARTRYITATTSHPDIIRAQIELAILEDRLKSLKELKPSIVTNLNAILNRPFSDDLPWPNMPDYQQLPLNFAQLYSMIMENNPNLQALEYEIQAARSGEKLAEKKAWPDIGVGLSYIDTAHARASGVSDSGKDSVIAMISLNLPIWAENYKAAKRQAQAQRRSVTHQRNQLQNDLASQAQQILYEYQDSNRKVRLYKDIIIPKANEMVTASESAYESGAIDFLSLIDAQKALFMYELDYERFVAQNSQKLAKIEMLAGAQLPIAETAEEN